MAINTFIFVSLALIIGIGIFFASHYFVYFSLLNFFQVQSPALRLAIIILLITLGCSFIISVFLASRYENAATRSLYFASSLWLGIITNLVIAFGVSWGIAKLINLTGAQAPNFLIGSVALLFAICFSVYGLWNAYHPVIKRIQVQIKNLPPEWKGKTVVQISDIHLGYILGKDFLANIVRQINELNPEAVFITGDLFDGMDYNLDVSIEPLDAISAPQGTFFITGNHETYLGVKKTYDVFEKTKVQILKDEMVDKQGLQIIGISYPERGEKKKLQAAIQSVQGFQPNKPSILLYHSPTQIPGAVASGVNLMLSGHTHKGQILPINIITKLIYKGYDYGLKKHGDFSIYTSCGTGAWGPTMRTGNRPEIVAITLN